MKNEEIANFNFQYSFMLYQLMEKSLTEYLKLLPQDYLETFCSSLLCDDLVGNKLEIYAAILNELEYRKSDLQLQKRKS